MHLEAVAPHVEVRRAASVSHHLKWLTKLGSDVSRGVEEL